MKTPIRIVFVCLLLAIGLMVTLAQSTTESDDIWEPSPGTTWQWQLTDTVDTSYDVDMYDVDLFDTSEETIDSLKARGVVVICYFSAGSYENWRSDANSFSSDVLGNKLDGWEGERWLNISDINSVSVVMLARLDLAVEKGCDGVEPDNVDGYTNNTGFNLTYEDQLAYAIWMSEQAHMRGLSIGLKNNLDQISDLLPFYDWALNEQCFQYDECDLLLPFIEAGKAVFGVEYELNQTAYCETANAYEFSWLNKTYDLGIEAPNSCQGDAPTVTPAPTQVSTLPPQATATTVVPTSVPTTIPTMVPTQVPTMVPTSAPIEVVPTEDPDEYNKKGYDAEGYDAEGYNKKSYDRDGYDRDGYNAAGYDEEGYDRDGYNAAGYDEQGYDQQGYDSEGYDEDGYDQQGYDSDGYDEQGYDEEGYDSDGYDQKGYDEEGYDSDGYDKKGCTRDGC